MGRLDGKVAFITGAARGQGRSHARRLAEEGAAIVAVDVCEDIDGIESPLATEEDLAETVRVVEEGGGRIIARRADVRSSEELTAAVDAGLSEFGSIDIVVANAAVIAYKKLADLTDEIWDTAIDVNVNGVYKTVKAALPSMIERGEGGAIVLISSGITYRTATATVDYVTAKTGLIGMMRSLAVELAPHWIRVNTIHPGFVLTPVLDNEVYGKRLAQIVGRDTDFADREERLQAMWELFESRHLLPIGWVDPVDISNGIVFLASDEARYITGEELKIDGGFASQ
jgi:SDR family mycofactocin-dependent oxidoreductase